jgi:hypothetical protein
MDHPGAGDHIARRLAVGGGQGGHIALVVGHAGVGRAPAELRSVARLPGGLQVLEGPTQGGEVGGLAPGAGRGQLLGQEAQAPADELATEAGGGLTARSGPGRRQPAAPLGYGVATGRRR